MSGATAQKAKQDFLASLPDQSKEDMLEVIQAITMAAAKVKSKKNK